MNTLYEQDPSQSGNFSLERTRLSIFGTGIYAMKMARSRMVEDIPTVVAQPVAETAVVIQMPEQRTASDNLAEIREQIRREAA